MIDPSEIESSDLVSKNADSGYDQTILLFQDILRFAVLEHPKFFKAWDLGAWLIDNNVQWSAEFVKWKDENKSKSKFNENRQRRLRKYLERLIFLEHVESKPSLNLKSSSPTKEFQVTFTGYMIGELLHERKQPLEEKTKIYDRVYNFLKTYYEYDRPTSYQKFYLIHLRKIKENNMLGEFMDSIKKIISVSNQSDLLMLFADLSFPSIGNNADESKKFWNIWDESLDELNKINIDLNKIFQMNPSIKEKFESLQITPSDFPMGDLFLFHITNLLQSKIEEGIKDFASYESSYYENLVKIGYIINNILTEGICDFCKKTFRYSEDTKLLIKTIQEDPFKPISLGKCNICKKGQILIKVCESNQSNNSI